MACLCLLLGGAVLLCAEEPAITVESLLKEMIDRDRIARWPQPEYTCRQASSYDRRSKTPADPNGWFANTDNMDGLGADLRWETHQGRREAVMMDVEGPGCVVRFWSGGQVPKGRIRFYLDGADEPAMAAPMQDLMSGKAFVPAPLAIENAGRAINLYLPVPYAKHCTITYDEANPGNPNAPPPGRWFNIEYRTYPAGTNVQTFTMDAFKAADGTLRRVAKELGDAPDPTGGREVSLDQTIEPGKGATIDLPGGPAALRRLTVRLDGIPQDEIENALRKTILRATFDGEEAIWCPVGDLFGSGVGLNALSSWYRTIASHTVQREYRGKLLRLNIQGLSWPADRGVWLTIIAGRTLGQAHYEMVVDKSAGLDIGDRIPLGKDTYTVVGLTDQMTSSAGDAMAFLTLADAQAVQEDRAMTCRWVMPYEKSARLSLLNLSKSDVAVKLSAAVGDWKWDGRSMHFHANWRQERLIHTRPFSDWNYVAITGKGVYLGDTLALFNPVRNWWGEGDEHIWVDGEAFPSHFGTGSEDYYGYAWGNPTVFQGPFCNQPRAGPGNFGHTTNTRTRSLDAIPFTKSLKADIEVWHWADCKVDYAATTYWYARPGAASNRGPSPEEATAELRQPPAPLKIKGAIECESLPVVAKAPGLVAERQDLTPFPGQWSGTAHLFVRGNKVGDFVEVRFPADKPGPRKLTLHATKSWDYGILRFSVNGTRLETEYDTYSKTPVPTGPIELGVFEPKDGQFLLRVEVVGANPQAKGSKCYFGLDCVVISDP